MKTESECIHDFWSSKLKAYEDLFTLRAPIQKKNVEVDRDMYEILNILEEKYGEENIEHVRDDGNKMHAPRWSVRCYLQKENSIYVTISNGSVSYRSYSTSFLINIHHEYDSKYNWITRSDAIWCSCNCKEAIIALVDRLHNDHEKNMAELQAELFAFEKEQKIHSLAQTSIRIVVQNIMSQSAYEWNLVEEERRSVLQIKMKRAMMMEISLGHKTFSKKIPKILSVIAQIEQLLGEIPYPVNIKRYGNNINWKKA